MQRSARSATSSDAIGVTRVVHWRKEPYDVMIDRSGPYGNPFSHKPGTKAQFRVRTREEAIERFREWAPRQPKLMALLSQLKGQRLGCWCKPLACHGDVYVELLEGAPVKHESQQLELI